MCFIYSYSLVPLLTTLSVKICYSKCFAHHRYNGLLWYPCCDCSIHKFAEVHHQLITLTINFLAWKKCKRWNKQMESMFFFTKFIGGQKWFGWVKEELCLQPGFNYSGLLWTLHTYITKLFFFKPSYSSVLMYSRSASCNNREGQSRTHKSVMISQCSTRIRVVLGSDTGIISKNSSIGKIWFIEQYLLKCPNFRIYHPFPFRSGRKSIPDWVSTFH